MFLEMAVRGSWAVLVAGHMEHLGFSGRQLSLVFAASSLSALISPLIAGTIADRFMSAQRFAAWCHFLGGLALLTAWRVESYPLFWAAMMINVLLFTPTLPLANAIAFHHMPRSELFGNVRLWGTVGWMTVNWLLSVYLWMGGAWLPWTPRLGDSLAAGAALSFVAAAFFLTLPDTPPAPGPRRPYAFLDAFQLTRNRNFAVILAAAFATGIQLPFFYNLTFLFMTSSGGGLGLPVGLASFAMTLGQVTEIVLLVVLARCLSRLGMKRTIALGMLALVVRFTVFAVGRPVFLVVAAQSLHGVDYAFFTVASAIVVERLGRRDVRASAQSLLAFILYGVGMLTGHVLSGATYDYFDLGGGLHDWSAIFALPLWIAVPSTLLFVLLFDQQRFHEDAGASSCGAQRRSGPYLDNRFR